MSGSTDHSNALTQIAAELASKLPREQKRVSRLTRIGFWATGAYLLFAAIMGIAAWSLLWKMSPNEFGDMLAGVFAPLAFLWLVLGFFQQGAELQASVEALQLQGEELRNSVAQQRELVEATREGIARDMEVAQDARKERERAAQPNFVPTLGGYISGNQAHYRLKFMNAGTGATNVAVIYQGNEVAKAPVFSEGAEIQFSTTFSDLQAVTEVSGFIEYTDAIGGRRAKSYTFPTIEGGQHPSLTDGTVSDIVYSPPFPWRDDAK